MTAVNIPNTAALRLAIQTVQGRARTRGEPRRAFTQAVPLTNENDAASQALERFATAYVDRVPDALDTLLQHVRAAFAAPLHRVLARALTDFTPKVLAQAPCSDTALLAAAYRVHRLLEEVNLRFAVWLDAPEPVPAPSLGNIIALRLLGQTTVATLEGAVGDWLGELDQSLTLPLTRQCFRSRRPFQVCTWPLAGLTRQRQRSLKRRFSTG